MPKNTYERQDLLADKKKGLYLMLDKVYDYPLKECARPACSEIVPRESASGKPRTKYVYEKRMYHSHTCSQLHSAEKHRENKTINLDSKNIVNRFLQGKV